MVKTLHWCALRITDLAYLVVRLGDHLWELGGNLEAWCDEKLNGPADLCLPNKGWLAVPPGLPPITMLDAYKGMDAKQAYDALLTEKEEL